MIIALPATAAYGSVDVVDVGPTLDFAAHTGASWNGVNENGQLAGSVPSGTTSRAARWDNGVTTPLGSAGTVGNAIADDGTVLGSLFVTGVADYPAWWDGTGEHSVQTASFANTEGGGRGGFHDVSHNGTAALTARPDPNVLYPHDYGARVAVSPFQSLNTQLIPDAGGMMSVNNSGHAIAKFVNSPYSYLYWDGATATAISIAPGGFHSLNDADTFVGSVGSPGTPAEQTGANPIVDTSVSLPLPPGTNYGRAVAINDQGVVVGNVSANSGTPPPSAVIWQPGGSSVATLDSLLPPGSPWHLKSVTDISDGNDILGIGTINGGPDHTFLILGRSHASVSGTVRHPDATPAPGTTVSLTGTDDSGSAVALSAVADEAGAYTFSVPFGTYSAKASGEATKENGGVLTVAACPGTPTGDTCALGHVATTAPTVADFTYTPCAAADRHPNGKGLTGCPVIFVPGFLGTKIACEGQELWPGLPHPDFANMQLLDGGFLNGPGGCNFVAEAIPGRAGLVTTVATQDIYQGAETYLDRIAPGRVTIFTYDWRRSPAVAVGDLAKTVSDVKAAAGASHVTIVAHSMGGLVTRAYIAKPSSAENVARVLTLGTPYWGAPKSHFALLEGDTDTPEIGVGSALDIITTAKDLQRFAGNSAGLFSLYPSAEQSDWLSVQSYGSAPQNAAGVDRWVKSLGATPALLDQALAFHKGLDTLDTNGIDYEVMIGTGVPTVSHIAILDKSPTVLVGVKYASGDGTVPAFSASMGNFSLGLPPQPDVAVHQACEVGHVGLPANPTVQARVKDFILDGTPVGGGDADNCFVTGEEVKTFRVKLAAGSARSAAVPPGSMTVKQALAAGLIQVYSVGGQDTIVMDKNRPVKLALSGVSVEVRAIKNKGFGATAQYKPVSGTVVIDSSGRAVKNGRKLKAAKADHKAPRTTARVKRHGKRYSVRLTAKDASGVGATWIRISKAQPKRYRKPFTVTAKQLKALRFSSVDVYGNVEGSRKAKAKAAR